MDCKKCHRPRRFAAFGATGMRARCRSWRAGTAPRIRQAAFFCVGPSGLAVWRGGRVPEVDTSGIGCVDPPGLFDQCDLGGPIRGGATLLWRRAWTRARRLAQFCRNCVLLGPAYVCLGGLDTYVVEYRVAEHRVMRTVWGDRFGLSAS